MERSSSSPTASMMSDNPLAMSRGERGRKFGIDCVNILSWSAGTWEPGGEYVKKLIVKNVSTQTVKIKYQIPATKFFSMEFPKMMILSPGMLRVLLSAPCDSQNNTNVVARTIVFVLRCY
jgi:hypothetical protein